MSLGVIGAASVKAAKRNIEHKLRRKGAISYETRVKPEEADLDKRELGWVDSLVEEGKIGKAEDGKIWWRGNC